MLSVVGVATVAFVGALLSGTAEPPSAHCVRFSSPPRIAAGTDFRVQLPRHLEVRLEPNGQGGWHIKVVGQGKTDFVWVVSPPFQTAPQLVIGAAYGVTAQQSAEMERWLRFVPTRAEYERALKVYEAWRTGQLQSHLAWDWLQGGDLETGTLHIKITDFGLQDRSGSLAWIEVEGEACVPSGPPFTPSGDQRPAAGANVTPDELIDRFKREQVFWRQFEIAQQLAASGDRGVVGELEGWLSHPDRRVRGNVAFVLAHLGDARGFQTIAGILGDRSSSDTGERDASTLRRRFAGERYYAARLFGVLKDPRAVPLLIPLLRDAEVRSVVPWSLAQIGDPRAIGPLLDVLDGDDPFMRVLAIFALETLNATQALPKLRGLLDDNRKTHAGEPITVAEAARRAINRIEQSPLGQCRAPHPLPKAAAGPDGGHPLLCHQLGPDRVRLTTRGPGRRRAERGGLGISDRRARSLARN
jgi:hypothetical protein